jgi:hypothetical protein
MGFSCSAKQGGTHKKSAGAGVFDRLDLRQGLNVTPDSGENCPSLALRPKLPATADQRAVRESHRLCRNRLLTGYNAAALVLAAETLFLKGWLPFQKLLLAPMPQWQA